VSAIEWLIWGALICLVFWAYQAIDLAHYLPRIVRPRPVRHVPHWARHGHTPPPDQPAAPQHGRHARRSDR